LRFNDSAWTLTRTGSGQVVPLNGSGTSADPFTAEGLSIIVGSGAAAGDSYLIRPTRAGAGAISIALDNRSELALAAPLRTSAALGNGGTGSITAGVVTDINNLAFQTIPGQLSPQVLIRFTSPTSYEVVEQTTLTTIDTATYDPAVGADVFPTVNLGIDYGYQARITGNPAAGDEFSIDYNSGGVGDNRNALLLAGLQGERLMDSGNTSFNDAFGGLVADIGSKTRQAQISSSAQQTILQQNQAQRASVSGVNLDEEAADLIRFQQAYQAAAQVIAVADTLFSTLIDAVRR
jgi:flagellar hook-associated protein 1 FlgK